MDIVKLYAHQDAFISSFLTVLIEWMHNGYAGEHDSCYWHRFHEYQAWWTWIFKQKLILLQIKKDESLPYKMERIPFLEEEVRKIKDEGKLLQLDIERLLLSEDNKYDFVNEIAAEANAYVESNMDEYGGEKKAILHVLSNRMNEAGFPRSEAYAEPDPFKPGPHYLKEFYT